MFTQTWGYSGLYCPKCAKALMKGLIGDIKAYGCVRNHYWRVTLKDIEGYTLIQFNPPPRT